MRFYLKTILISILVAFMVPYLLSAADCPIIFLHGQKGAGDDNKVVPDDCWPDWNPDNEPYKSAMQRILEQHYGGYSAGYLTNGDSIDCDKNSVLQPTGGETRKIYNFSYYNPDGSKGVIGSNGHILPEDYRDWRTKYEDALANASWAEHFAIFVEKVLNACYGSNWQSNPDAKTIGDRCKLLNFSLCIMALT